MVIAQQNRSNEMDKLPYMLGNDFVGPNMHSVKNEKLFYM